MSDELKPVNCRCGGEAIQICRNFREKEYYGIFCIDCGIQIMRSTETEAVEAWNTAMGEMEKCCNTCDSYEGHYCLLWSIFCPSDHYCKDWSWAETDEDEDEPAAQTRPL